MSHYEEEPFIVWMFNNMHQNDSDRVEIEDCEYPRHGTEFCYSNDRSDEDEYPRFKGYGD